jgi:trehalose/maltose hydrolase-like predicted phosphorylase
VFWDADTFTLPFLAATHPAAARAMLDYRIRRLPLARARARELGRRGARFPWESARTGDDVTPVSARDRTGHLVPIRTGALEEHIVAQVAWAASLYGDWTGDDEFIEGAGRELLVETARYWASRVRLERDGGHIFGVIGPDEYHEPVDDNAFTNVMARWNLRAAADAVERTGAPEADEASQWRTVADALVDGYDPDTGIYEQFAGFHELEPLVIAEVAPKRPIAADLWLGPTRVHGAQVLKQADVLMLHHLVPDAVEPDSLEPNLRFYEPRTAHGSSLSPGVHAALFARTRDYDKALDALHIASRIDLDDLTDTTAGGLHLATMGSLWQALAFGFAGLRAHGGALAVDPRLPHSWATLALTVRFHGSRVGVRIEHGALHIEAERPTPITIDTLPYTVDSTGLEFTRRSRTWNVVT